MSRRAPRLVAITDLEALEAGELVARLTELTRSAVPGSVAVLLRDHSRSARERLELGQRLRDLTRRTQQQLWVADRLDLALLLEADGAHLGEASVAARDARRLLGPERFISRAWHRADVVAPSVELEGVDALLVSPIFAPRKGRMALGAPVLTALGAALKAVAHPARVYALGGVTVDAVQACDSAGAAGVAAIGAALGPDPSALLEALRIRQQ